MEQQLLVPFDDSDQAMNALEYALEAFPEADVTILHVLDPSEWVGYAGMEGGAMIDFNELHTQREAEAKKLLDNARETAEAYDTEVTTVV